MPRKVPRSLLKGLLICTKRVSRPASANSRSQKKRAKKPRSSSRLSSSITKAPGSGVGTKRIGPSRCLSRRLGHQPVETMAQGAQSHEPIAVEVLSRKPVRAIVRQQLFHAGGECVFQPKIGQQAAKLGEIDAIVARVLADLAGIDNVGARHQALDDRGNVADSVILGVAADIDRLIVDGCARRIETGDKGAGDILAVDQ